MWHDVISAFQEFVDRIVVGTCTHTKLLKGVCVQVQSGIL